MPIPGAGRRSNSRRFVAAACAIAAAWTWTLAGVRGVRAQADKAQDTFTTVYNGWKWWHSYCFRCHGMNAIGPTTLGPSLIESKSQLTLPEFAAKVKLGGPHKTVQGWNTLLDKQINEIYAYLEARADKVLPAGRPDEVGPNGGHWVPPEGWPKKN